VRARGARHRVAAAGRGQAPVQLRVPSDNSILENLGEIRITVESLWKMLFSSPRPRCRTGSLRTAISVAGKRIFEGRDKELETARRFKNAVAETKSR
jgi:hypothetical protein